MVDAYRFRAAPVRAHTASLRVSATCVGRQTCMLTATTSGQARKPFIASSAVRRPFGKASKASAWSKRVGSIIREPGMGAVEDAGGHLG